MIKSPDFQYLKHFFEYASRYKKTAVIGLAMMPISVLANLLFPWLVIQVIDEHLTPGKYAGMMLLISFMLLVLVVNLHCRCYLYYCLRLTGQKAVFDIRMALFTRILKLPRTYYDKTPTGVTLSRLTSDLEVIGESFVLGVLSLVKDLHQYSGSSHFYVFH